jgi:hypothetical protein
MIHTILFLLLGAAGAQAQDSGTSSTDHDTDVFGGQSSTPPASQTPATTDQAKALEAPARSDSSIASTLAAADKRLTLGGQIYLRGNISIPDQPTLSTTTLDCPNLLDFFADARPNDVVRGFAQGRLVHDWSIPATSTASTSDTDGGTSSTSSFVGTSRQRDTVILDQLWLNLNLKNKVYLTLGQQRIKWGTGHFWNPTDFMDPVHLNPLAYFDERTGVPLVKVNVPLQKIGANLYAFGMLQDAASLDRVGGAVRAEWLVGLTEIALSSTFRKGDPLRLGGQVSSSLGLVDLRGEVAVLHGSTTPAFEGSLDWSEAVFPTTVDRRDDWIPQAVAGAELGLKYTSRNSLYLGLEYFFNDAGTDDPSIYPYLLAIGQYTPFYLGRNYGGAYVSFPGIGAHKHHNIVFSNLGNLSDESFVARVDWSAQLLTELNVNAYAQAHYGQKGGEFRLTVDIPPESGNFESGLFVPPPLVDVGLGASVAF